jgi:hypothetical protein
VSAEALYGRDSEVALLDEWLRDLGERGRALLVRGDPGIGKTALLDAAADAARSRGCRVLTVTGVECEAHLPFAGLHQLLRPELARAEGLPAPQGQARLTAFGILDAGVPAIFLVGLAALNLLADVAADEPLLLVADDVHWLDTPTAEVLAFVGRRLESDRILVLAAMRDGVQSPLTAARLPELVLEPLGEAPSAHLLDARAPDLTRVARSRILHQAAGNPLALLELPRALRSERLAGGRVLPAILPMTDRLESAFAAQGSNLPPATQAALLVAAVDDRRATAEVLSAAARLTGAPVAMDILDPAVQAGPIAIVGDEIRFRHPLVRSAIEQSAPVGRRHEAHAALAEVLTDDPDRRAWHRAALIVGTDEGAAAELEAAAPRAQDRATGIAMAAQEGAAALTEDRGLRVGRLLAAAEMGFELGQPAAVRRLLDEAEQSGPAPLDRAIFNDGVPGDPIAVQRLVAAADEAAGAGDRSLALNLLHGAALSRARGSDVSSATRSTDAITSSRAAWPGWSAVCQCGPGRGRRRGPLLGGTWEKWGDRYSRRGYQVIGRSWPGMEGGIDELRRDPSGIEHLGIGEIVDYYDGIIRGLDRPPIVMGHSFGGAFTEILLDRGLGAAGVAIDAAAVRGILKLPFSTLKSAWPVLRSPANEHKAVALTPDEFHYAFGNTLSEEDSRAVYERYAGPGPGRVLFQGALANFNPHAPTRVDFGNPDRAPLLLMAGGADHIVPAAVDASAARHYAKSPAVTAYRSFPGRSHYTIGEPRLGGGRGLRAELGGRERHGQDDGVSDVATGRVGGCASASHSHGRNHG